MSQFIFLVVFELQPDIHTIFPKDGDSGGTGKQNYVYE